jgi:long-chain acyl-CoA synthetase
MRDEAGSLLPQRPWLSHYPDFIDPEIDPDAFGTVADLVRDAVAQYPDRPALESFGKTLTYEQLGENVDAVSRWLCAQGLAKGDRIGLMMPNVAAYPALIFGVLKAGMVVVNINPLYTPRELIHQLQDSGAKALFVLENFACTVESALSSLSLEKVILVKPGDGLGLKGAIINFVSRYIKKAVKPFSLPGSVFFAEVIKTGPQLPPCQVRVSMEDIAFLQYTGGTTGVSKGAVLTHRNVMANLGQIKAWILPFIGRRSDHVMVTALPLYHIFALTACCLFMTRIGACQLLIVNPRDIPGFIKTLKGSRFTIFSGVNTLYNALANASNISQVDFSSLVFCVSGGMATQEAVAKRWKALTGKPIVEGYGLSETSPVVCVNRPDIEDFTSTIGYPVPSTDIFIRAPDGTQVPLGEPGELCVKGPQVMPGYWQRADETAKVMTEDGFFRTGDIAILRPDGQVKIIDRMKDMILVSGFNVYPNEVEEVLASHPGILESAVIGIPDEHSGEGVAAYIVRKDPYLEATTIKDYCRTKLAHYKVPRRIEFRESLPKTNVGKVLRRILREETV